MLEETRPNDYIIRHLPRSKLSMLVDRDASFSGFRTLTITIPLDLVFKAVSFSMKALPPVSVLGFNTSTVLLRSYVLTSCHIYLEAICNNNKNNLSYFICKFFSTWWVKEVQRKLLII